jgi:hypothetical protein
MVAPRIAGGRCGSCSHFSTRALRAQSFRYLAKFLRHVQQIVQ